MTANTNDHKSPRAGKKRRALGYKGQDAVVIAPTADAIGFRA
jgi:hypothetical protein